MNDSDPFPPALVEALARHLAGLAGQNPEGVYKTAYGSAPAWHGYRSDALSVLFKLQEHGFKADDALKGANNG